jgi:fatty-acyl-CoA synthase
MILALAARGRTTSTQAWARALQNIAPLQRDGTLTLPTVVDGLAERHGAAAALIGEHDHVTYTELAQRKNQYARWALEQGLAQGGAVALLMSNCPDYLAIWLGISQTGAVVALINTNLTGHALRHSIDLAGAQHIIAGTENAMFLDEIRAELPPGTQCWVAGEPGTANAGFAALTRGRYAGHKLTGAECPAPSARNTALLIYTSGTTGRPKAARISHYRVLEWSFWFAGMMDTGTADRLFDCLPMYHSTGGVAVLGGVLVNGGAIVIRQRFSARRFWDDVASQGCTLFVYIGELCRYLVNAPPHDMEARHRLRLCCGNGLREDVWQIFEQRFHIPQILEFYASTEGNVALYNCEGRPGAIGRVPAFLAHRFPVALIECDAETGEPRRGPDGRCIVCPPDTEGEAIGKIVADSRAGPNQFEGYTEQAATEKKILRDALAQGDAWFRTGDLMRRDAAGFYYFVDRLGDNFRWKGENVSTAHVAEALCRCTGVTGAAVYGVAVPGTEGRAGMAAITADADFDAARLRAALVKMLPAYARPVFLRICPELETTGTFKPIKARLAQQGYALDATADPIYVDDPSVEIFRRLDAELLGAIQAGKLRF